jgi:hypothetical protein
MARESDERPSYAVPRYHAEGDPAWYHVLHGTVPGHQIDFIYCPEVPQGPLKHTHFAHVARLIKYIEPREQASFAFAIGNLSRDDVRHDPGHGGLAVIFGLRVEGAVDHASRSMPPYAHGLLAVDRALDYGVLIDAITAFHRRFASESSADAGDRFYRSYVKTMREDPGAVEEFLKSYVAEFDDLPHPGPSHLGWDFVAPEDARLQRLTIVHPDGEPFSTVTSVAATLGSLLYRSNVKWTTISNSREFDIPGGISIRFVPESEAPRDSKGLVLRLDDVPGEEAEIAEKLFSAKPRETGVVVAPRRGWREQMAEKSGNAPNAAAPRENRAASGALPVDAPGPVRARRLAQSEPPSPLAADTSAAGTPALQARASETGSQRVQSAQPSAHVSTNVTQEALPTAAPSPLTPPPTDAADANVDDAVPTVAASLEPVRAVDVEVDDAAPTLAASLEAVPAATSEVDDTATTVAAPLRSASDATPLQSTPNVAIPASPPSAPKEAPSAQLPRADSRVSAREDTGATEVSPAAGSSNVRWIVIAGVVGTAIAIGLAMSGSSHSGDAQQPAGSGTIRTAPPAQITTFHDTTSSAGPTTAPPSTQATAPSASAGSVSTGSGTDSAAPSEKRKTPKQQSAGGSGATSTSPGRPVRPATTRTGNLDNPL